MYVLLLVALAALHPARVLSGRVGLVDDTCMTVDAGKIFSVNRGLILVQGNLEPALF
jgi:hypothetical protein